MSIVTLTMNPTVDTTTVAKRLLPDRKLRCSQPQHDPGGGGINVARAVKKLGGDPLALFPVGGANGEHMVQLLENEKVRVRKIQISGMTRENVTVQEESEEQQYRFVMPGPELNEEEWHTCLSEIENMDPAPEYLVASGSLPRGVPSDFYGRLADLAVDRDIRLVVDTSGDSLRNVLGKTVYLIKPNIRELTEVLGIDDEENTDIENAAREIVKKCSCQHVVVSLGSGGALLLTEGRVQHYRSPTVKIRSKVGAGDSMVAGIVFSLDRSEDIVQATKYGIAAGASAVTTPGSELCRRETTEELVKKI